MAGFNRGLNAFLTLTVVNVLYFSNQVSAQSVSAMVGGLSATPTSLSPTSMFWNPAIIGALPGSQIETNITLMGGWLVYDRAGNDPNTGSPFSSSSMNGLAPNLFLAASSPLGTENFRFAYGTYFPSGVMAEFNEEGSQRYDLIDGLLIPWHHQITVAWKARPELSFAVAAIGSIGFFRTQLDVDMGKLMKSVLNSQDIPSEHKALAARARVPLTWTPAIGAAVGMYWRPSYQISVGFAAFTPIHYDFSGNLNLQTPEIGTLVGAGLPALGIDPTIENQIEAHSSIPGFVQLGLRYQPFGYWAQEYFTRYSFSSLERSLAIEVKSSSILELQKLKVAGDELNDSWMVGSVQTFPLWQNWTPGLYASFYKNAAKERYFSVSRADFDALAIGALLKYQWKHSIQFGVEYAHSFLFDQTPKDTVHTSSSALLEHPSSDGRYRAGVDRAGLTVRYVF